MNSVNFLDLAKQGKNQWWRYLIGVLSVMACWLLSSVFVATVAFLYWLAKVQLPVTQAMGEGQQFETWLQKPDLIVYIFLNLPFIPILLTIFAITRWVHQRPVGTLISGRRSPNWQRIFTGFWVWGLLLALVEIPLYLMHPQAYKLTFDPSNWFIFVAIALVLTPLQTSTEEFFFRGYILQGMGLLVRNRVILSVLNGIIFGIPHFSNPEMARNPSLIAFTYIFIGIFLAYITLRDQSLDLALGVHAANNLYSFLLVNTADSVMPTKPLIMNIRPEHPVVSLLVLLLMIGMFNLSLFGRKTKPVIME